MVVFLILLLTFPLFGDGIVQDGLHTLADPKKTKEPTEEVKKSEVKLPPDTIAAFVNNYSEDDKNTFSFSPKQAETFYPKFDKDAKEGLLKMLLKEEIVSSLKNHKEYDNWSPKKRDEIVEEFLNSKIGFLAPLLDESKTFTNTQAQDVVRQLPLKSIESLLTALIHQNPDYIAYDAMNKQQLMQALASALDDPTLKALVDNIGPEEKTKLLSTLLQQYQEVERQAAVNALLGGKDYCEFWKNNPSEEILSTMESVLNPHYIWVTLLIDFLNNVNRPSYYHPTPKNALFNRKHFNDFNTFEQFSIFIEPYSYFTAFDRSSDPLKFNLHCIGLSLGGEYTFAEHLTLGVGLTYSFSELQWKNVRGLAKVHTLYFGPSIGYLFSRGTLSLALQGAMNFTHMERALNLFNLEKETLSNYNNGNLNTRFEGNFSQPLGKSYYLYPSFRFNYLVVFQGESKEKLDKKSSLKIKSFTESFFHARLALELKKEIYQANLGFIIPSIIWGWNYYKPLSKCAYNYSVKNCEQRFIRDCETNAWNAFSYGFCFSFVHKSGTYLSLLFEFSMGSGITQGNGTLRVSWSW